MPIEHLHHLFSAAYDEALSEQQSTQFHDHVRTCAECAAAYRAFRTSIDAVRALPAARMPHPVHLPSTAPVAELPSFAARVRRLPRLRLFPGAATGVAALAAAAIVVFALSHGGGGSGSSNSAAAPATVRNPAATTAACVVPLATAVSAPPAQYQHQVSAADPGRPGQQLVVATSTGAATAGSDVVVFAQLSFPLPAAGAANAPIAPVARTGAVPCLSLSGSNGASFSPNAAAIAGAPGASVPNGAPQAAAGSALSPLSQLQTFAIPAGTPAGTVLHIVASVPANYPLPGDPPLMVDLVITVQ